ncbi:nitric oxide synthase [Pseudomonas sp. ICMP22404]|uniref:flavodoxin domain-containing protein n=1 Tax=Pseudomonas sp. ICMP22404 TaxID=2583807 RepID=UPI0011191934|nr:flavodoxin family protein [Pseudomonas sp. ICMP22404]TNF83394.1 nitric oxide synthase [Pseudomonas sp. ICMP22404]
MFDVLVAYGTESGNAEMAADDIAANLEARGIKADVKSLDNLSITELSKIPHFVIVTSTYGEGELPETTAPFYAELDSNTPDLSGITFSAFGLGDSTYNNFNNAINIVSRKLIELGATQLGETGMHDAATGKSLTLAATTWIDMITINSANEHNS